jgi:hypothetical protein
MTVDVDLILGFEPDNLLAAMRVLGQLGYHPRIPVPIEAFADEAQRTQWVRDRHMQVFSLTSDKHPQTELDLFVSDPLGFDQAYARAQKLEVASGIIATICCLDDLLLLKRLAGRPQDLADIAQLKALHDLP